MTAYPDKALYKIGEVCQYPDTQPYVLRFWESEFPQLAPEKNANGQRVYRKDDIELIFRIKNLLYEEEYTIAGARRKLEQGDAAEPPPKSAKRSPAKTPEAPAAERGKWFEDGPAAPPAEAGPADTALEAEHFRKLHVEAKHENERIAGLHAAAVAEIARLHDEIQLDSACARN